MPGFYGYSECAKIAKNLSPFMAADFSLFCHGFRPRGPSRPPHPFALAAALRSSTWSGGFVRMGTDRYGGEAVGVSGNAG